MKSAHLGLFQELEDEVEVNLRGVELVSLGQIQGIIQRGGQVLFQDVPHKHLHRVHIVNTAGKQQPNLILT